LKLTKPRRCFAQARSGYRKVAEGNAAEAEGVEEVRPWANPRKPLGTLFNPSVSSMLSCNCRGANHPRTPAWGKPFPASGGFEEPTLGIARLSSLMEQEQHYGL
jgi:hypothetical protein